MIINLGVHEVVTKVIRKEVGSYENATRNIMTSLVACRPAVQKIIDVYHISRFGKEDLRFNNSVCVCMCEANHALYLQAIL
jgi:hypothetical protein